ncbi:MAG: helix-turn-helix domain-containing protein [Spirochaetota bacterium]
MDKIQKVIEAFKKSSEPLNASAIAKITGLDKKEVDKILAKLKKDGFIESPKRCYWTLK